MTDDVNVTTKAYSPDGSNDESGPSVRLRGHVWSTCLRSGGGGILGGGLGTSFVSVHGDKLGVSEGAVDGNMVGLAGRDTGVAVLGQEYVLFYGKEPVEVREVKYGTATIMGFWTLEGACSGGGGGRYERLPGSGGSLAPRTCAKWTPIITNSQKMMGGGTAHGGDTRDTEGTAAGEPPGSNRDLGAGR